MKRFLLVLLLLVVVGGGGAAWWVLRDTPEKVLRDGMQALMAMRSAGAVSAEISITDVSARTTSGYSLEGQMDVSDLAQISGLGVIRIGSKTQTGQDETLDVVVNSSVVAFRPNDVTAAHREEYALLAGSATETVFLAYERGAFLHNAGYGEAVAKGAAKDVRATLQFALPTIATDGALRHSELNGVPVVTVGFRFNRNELRAFLIALVKSWTGKNPTPDAYAWVERTAGGLSRGDFAISIDTSSRAPVQLTGTFPLIDDYNIEVQRVRFTVSLSEINAPINIVTPVAIKDLTSTIRTADVTALPGSESRSIPEGFVQPTAETQKQQIDLFSKFQEEIKRKKNLY